MIDDDATPHCPSCCGDAVVSVDITASIFNVKLRVHVDVERLCSHGRLRGGGA